MWRKTGEPRDFWRLKELNSLIAPDLNTITKPGKYLSSMNFDLVKFKLVDIQPL